MTVAVGLLLGVLVICALAVAISRRFPRAEVLAGDLSCQAAALARENAARLATLESLPTCCAESADALEKVRSVYEAADVFRPRMIDGILQALRAHDDAKLQVMARREPELMRKLVDQYFDCG